MAKEVYRIVMSSYSDAEIQYREFILSNYIPPLCVFERIGTRKFMSQDNLRDAISDLGFEMESYDMMDTDIMWFYDICGDIFPVVTDYWLGIGRYSISCDQCRMVEDIIVNG